MEQTVPLNTPAPLFRLLLLLSATTGIVDAASILGMDKVFTANMTGNIVFLAFAAVGHEGFHIWHYIAALSAFMLGAVIAGRLGRRGNSERLSHWLIVAALIESAMLFLAGLFALHLQFTVEGYEWGILFVIALTAGAMGFRNAVVRQLKVPDLTTTVLTLTITGIAADSRLASGSGTNLKARLSAVAMIFAGAAIGAAFYLWLGLGPTLLLAGFVVLVGTAVFVRHPQMTELERM